MMRILTNIAASTFLLLGLTSATASAQQNQPADGEAEGEAETAMEMQPIEHVALETNVGTIVLALDAENSPISTENFLTYAEDGFYEGTIFHRVIADFMIQGGGFTEDMDQKPTREPIENEWENGLDNTRGTIAMARTSDPDSATSQFFINVKDNNRLDQPISGGAGYAAFGTVVGGMDVVDAIENVETQTISLDTGQMRDVPGDPIVIEKTERLSEEEADALLESLDDKNSQAIKAWKEGKQDRAQSRRDSWLENNQDQFAEAENFIESTGVDVNSAYKLESGIWVLDERAGEGEEVEADDDVSVHYDVWLTDGTPRGSSRDRGEKAVFNLDGRTIQAWKEGLPGMKEGGIRWLVAPPYLAKSAAGSPGISDNDALIFKIELFDVPEE